MELYDTIYKSNLILFCIWGWKIVGSFNDRILSRFYRYEFLVAPALLTSHQGSDNLTGGESPRSSLQRRQPTSQLRQFNFTIGMLFDTRAFKFIRENEKNATGSNINSSFTIFLFISRPVFLFYCFTVNPQPVVIS